MPAIHIRDIPEDVLAALKRRAATNHRSLQMELRYTLIQLARQGLPEEASPELDLKMSRATSGNWSREEIYGHDGR
ncbi:hypothetical protein IV102_03830 [bacterium]|nr:hypothetical protein [bacterium]